MARTQSDSERKPANRSKIKRKPQGEARGRAGQASGVVGELVAAIAAAERRGMTRYQIARAAGVTETMVKRAAEGANLPRVDTVGKIAAALGFRLTLLPN